ncbi:DUF3019 domain-containing protein [Colwellia sp. TT2012]|uniref:DUF3019 domain-containing protein n=1 Tax=Colwellia sp. TT2012 TaxID=1720342 RepID=UPI000B19FF68|nr:DUF3019 domain-containing protein [Colwellia sp. TT2012]
MPFFKITVKTTVNTIEMSKLTPWIQLALLLCVACLFIPGSANAAATQANTSANNSSQLAQLKVTPKPCVALHKGQKCYLEVTFSWQHPKISNYCLVNTTRNQILKCWQQQATGEFDFDFQSTLTNDFSLRKHDSTVDLAQATIPVAWVYKSSKRAKSTWRLF